jgi:hypothetical protein
METSIAIDSLALTLGRFLRRQDNKRTAHEDRTNKGVSRSATSTRNLITLSNGQMLLPGTEASHLFLQ